MHHRHRGFTLVELAIVLVIIGLISGGVLAGSNMIRNSEVQNIGTELQEIETAVNNFKDHYFALPGDYARATDQWGILAGTGNDATCQNTEALNTTATCNGNDDGFVTSAGGVAESERIRFWQHLANAGMYKGPFTGRAITPGGFDHRAGYNAPGSKVDSGVYRAYSASGDCGPCGQFMSITRGVYLEFRAEANIMTDPLTPAETEMVDRKFDDGRPGTGKLIAPRLSAPAFPNCTTSDDPAVALYNAADDNRHCVFNYKLTIQ